MLLPSVPLDAIRQPAFVYAAEGRIVAANSPIQALAGRSLAGCTATDILATFRNRHPDGTPFLPHELPLSRALRDEKTVDVPMTITAADGREHHLLVSASPLRDGGRITAALVVWQDVTGIRRAEEALAESEDLFRRTFDQSPIASSLLLPDSTLLRANTALCQMLGYSEGELQRMLFPELTHPDDVDEDLRLATDLASGAIDQYQARQAVHPQGRGRCLGPPLRPVRPGRGGAGDVPAPDGAGHHQAEAGRIGAAGERGQVPPFCRRRHHRPVHQLP